MQYFRFAGQFLGKALFDHQNVPIHLIMVMYKHMLGMPITINDLEAIDYSLKQGLIQMKKLEDVSVVDEGFVVTEKIFGANVQRELKPGGNDIDVTNENFINNFNIIVKEVDLYGNALSGKPRITVLNKIDALGEDERIFYREQLAKIIDEPVFMISAVSGEGIENLLRAIRLEVEKGKGLGVEEEQGSLEWHP